MSWSAALRFAVALVIVLASVALIAEPLPAAALDEAAAEAQDEDEAGGEEAAV